MDGKGCVIITNPGIFINVNDSVPTSCVCFCNFYINGAPDSDNLFVEISYFPYMQHNVQDIAEDLQGNIAAAGASPFLQKVNSYFQSFDKLGQYLHQRKPLDLAYIEFKLSPDALITDLSVDLAYAPYSIILPKADFTDYFSSGFDVYVISGHVSSEDIPDINNIDVSAFDVLYSSNPVSVANYRIPSFFDKVNAQIKTSNYTYLFPGFAAVGEGDTFAYSAALLSPVSLDFGPEIPTFTYSNKKYLFNSKIEPFFHLICSKLDPSVPDMQDPDLPLEAGVNQDPYVYKAPLVCDKFPLQLSYFPVPIGTATEVIGDEKDYIRKYGVKVEFKMFFYFPNSWDVGSFDEQYAVGVYCHNRSKQIDVLIESKDGTISSMCPRDTINQYLGEVTHTEADFISTSLKNTAILDKYNGLYFTGSEYGEDFGYGSGIVGEPVVYSSETGDYGGTPTGVTSPASRSTAAAFIDCIQMNISSQKFITKEHDTRFAVFTFYAYIVPINGYDLAQDAFDSFSPGYVDSDVLLADGLVDVMVEFCEPLWDEVAEEYKYLSCYESADHRQFDGIYRIYSAMMYPHYLKKSG